MEQREQIVRLCHSKLEAWEIVVGGKRKRDYGRKMRGRYTNSTHSTPSACKCHGETKGAKSCQCLSILKQKTGMV